MSLYLTAEDHEIFRRMSVIAQARLHKADRRDAERMRAHAQDRVRYDLASPAVRIGGAS